MKQLLTVAITFICLLAGCTTAQQAKEKPYVIEVTTFKYKAEVAATAFWKRDAQIQADYTSKQPGFIKRESGLSDDGDVVVVVYWQSNEDAAASMQKFMQDSSVADYAGMIDGPTMMMKRYNVK